MCGSTHCFAAGVCPLGLMRGLNQAVLAVPHPRFASEAPPAHPRCRVAALPHQAAAFGGGRGRSRFLQTAPEGTTPARSRRPSREDEK